MPESWSNFPFWITFILFFFGAMVRGQATYWIARVVTEQSLKRTHPTSGWRRTVHDWLQGDSIAKGSRLVRKFGLSIVPFAYLTVGLQTVIIASAGVLRLKVWHFTLAQVPGALAWATIYTTIGFAVWAAAISAAAGNPYVIGALTAIVVAVVVYVLVRRRRQADAETVA
ncbi:VTT domain-containing protein [Tessaracoccus sp. OS52]|uniref:DedA family protein n=1 Tax=Tessaracoccus sp. OS52 TaxID=2886691 RepID=UPI001D0F8189|nr:VTT domain-containing protein [Tessaracoccus sp. OS52]MCC2592416.1 VTT domain-containing protein [Tessaracoccus sp. OS52]